MATRSELYATPTWALFRGQVIVNAGGFTPTVGAPGLTIVLESSVTAPVRAKARPLSAAPVASEIDA